MPTTKEILRHYTDYTAWTHKEQQDVMEGFIDSDRRDFESYVRERAQKDSPDLPARLDFLHRMRSHGPGSP